MPRLGCESAVLPKWPERLSRRVPHFAGTVGYSGTTVTPCRTPNWAPVRLASRLRKGQDI